MKRELNVILVGNAGVGKTSFAKCLTGKQIIQSKEEIYYIRC